MTMAAIIRRGLTSNGSTRRIGIEGRLREPESALLRKVIELARLYGWRAYHTHDSRRSEAGFPDLVLVNGHQGRVIFAELKAVDGRLTPAQRDWLHEIQQCGQEAYVWRPGDLADIGARLSGKRERRTREAQWHD